MGNTRKGSPIHPATAVTAPAHKAGLLVLGDQLAQTLPRFQAEHERVSDERKLAKILLETGTALPDVNARATAPGDTRKLRGIPAHANGVTGVITGGNEYAVTMAQRPLAA